MYIGCGIGQTKAPETKLYFVVSNLQLQLVLGAHFVWYYLILHGSLLE